MHCSKSPRRRFGATLLFVLCLAVTLTAGLPAHAGVLVTPTTNPADLQSALNATGLTITSVSIVNGTDGQFGTYTNFTTPPVTIGNGVILSSGNVAFVGPPADPILDYPQPYYDMATSGTAEFNAYGPGRIENFGSSNDVAAL